jgi:ADP-ribose pyrophosphatase YjhB (NUDIX family)
MDRKFNVRVYGICFNEKKELLVADELIKGREITKLPGGGLEFGEGTIDCIKREFIEETGQEVEVIAHFYTTDFFVPSAFNPHSQVISIYYLVKLLKPPAFAVTTKPFDFPKRDGDLFVFRWMPASAIHPDEFTFPIDKRVAEMLRAKTP